MQTLHDIARVYGYGKIASYIDVYAELFEPLRDKSVKILEIGVYDGASMKMWLSYFPNAFVVGLDNLNIANLKGFEDRSAFYHGDQADIKALSRITDDHRQFDIIIDDAAHIGEVARFSYNFLFNFIIPGGLYIIEDWGTGYWPNWIDGKQFSKGHYSGMVGFVKDLVDESGRNDRVPNQGLSSIDHLRISHGQVIVKKRFKR